jgi:hypothetical protein
MNFVINPDSVRKKVPVIIGFVKSVLNLDIMWRLLALMLPLYFMGVGEDL